jgi:IPT/TIG domain/Glucose / Sorbosone dehydrogenase
MHCPYFFVLQINGLYFGACGLLSLLHVVLFTTNLLTPLFLFLSTGDKGELYICVGSNTNAGLPSSIMEDALENYFSAAVLVANMGVLGFSGIITYDAPENGNPVTGFGPSGVEVFAAGLRNPFGVFVHSNGNVYATDNGPNANYGPISVDCTGTQKTPRFTEEDKLVLLQKGGFYGHANRKRGETDPRQCIWRSSYAPSTSDYTAPLMSVDSSMDGIIEFESDHFDGQLRGDLILSKYQQELYRVILTNNGQSVSPFSNPAVPLTGNGGLAVTQAPDGTLVEARHGSNSVYTHKPIEAPTSVMGVKSVFPRRGRLAGNSKLMIFGVNFSGSPTVTIGGSACTSVVLVSAKKIECILPLGTAGRKDVIVTIGSASYNFVKGYRYITGTPP